MRFSIVLGTLLPLAVLAKPVRRQFDAERITWYDVGAGTTACGGTYSNSDPVVALSSAQFDGGASCGSTVSVNVDGQTLDATVADLCPGCPDGGLDLSSGAFSELGSLDTGVISGSWEFSS